MVGCPLQDKVAGPPPRDVVTPLEERAVEHGGHPRRGAGWIGWMDRYGEEDRLIGVLLLVALCDACVDGGVGSVVGPRRTKSTDAGERSMTGIDPMLDTRLRTTGRQHCVHQLPADHETSIGEEFRAPIIAQRQEQAAVGFCQPYRSKRPQNGSIELATTIIDVLKGPSCPIIRLKWL